MVIRGKRSFKGNSLSRASNMSRGTTSQGTWSSHGASTSYTQLPEIQREVPLDEEESYEEYLVNKYGDASSQTEFEAAGWLNAIGGPPKKRYVYGFGQEIHPQSIIPQCSQTFCAASHPPPPSTPHLYAKTVASAIKDPLVVTSLAQNTEFVQALMGNSCFRAMMKDTMMEIMS